MKKCTCLKAVIAVCFLVTVVLGFNQTVWAWGGEPSTAIHIAKLVDARLMNPDMTKNLPDLEYAGVHYNKTLAWAMDEGFSKETSKLIAESCLDIDSGETFKSKDWHLGQYWFNDIDSWDAIKAGVYAPDDYFDRYLIQDTRINHALNCMYNARQLVDEITPLSTDVEKNYKLALAYTYIGNGLHPLQDYFAHMNAGRDPSSLNWLENYHHGEQGRDAYVWGGSTMVVSVPLELLYDATNIDYVDNQWTVVDESDNVRLQKTDLATRQYLRDFQAYYNEALQKHFMKDYVKETKSVQYEKSSFEGTVRNVNTGQPVANATVQVISNGNVVEQRTTNANGYYQFYNVNRDYLQGLLPGTYGVQILVNGDPIYAEPQSITLAANTHSTRNYTIFIGELVRLETVPAAAQVGLKIGEMKTLEDFGVQILAVYDNGYTEDITRCSHKFVIGTDAAQLNPAVDIAYLQQEGSTDYIRGVNYGTATLRCMLWDNGNDAADFQYTDVGVTVYGLVSLAADPASLQINVGDDVRIVADLGVGITGLYEDGGTLDLTPYTIFFISGSESAATVRPEGDQYYIRGVAGGTATLRAQAWNGSRGEYQIVDIPVTVMAPYETGQLEGIVRDAVSGSAISDALVGVYNGAVLLGEARTSASGQFSIATAPGTGYRVEISKDGYLTENYANIEIVNAQTTYLETILQVSDLYAGYGNVNGYVRNAVTGSGVSGLTLTFRRGINVMDGAAEATTVTGSGGYYTLNDLAAGSYTVEISGTGYNMGYFTVVCLGGQTRGSQNGTVTPIMPEGQTRIVLTWGASPGDLDSYLMGPSSDGGRFQICYWSKTYFYDGTSYADLDLDDTSSYGPETTTIRQQVDGTYVFSVHDYTNRGSAASYALSNSGAQVKVYRGESLAATYNVPANQVGTLWTVFQLNGDELNPINSLTSAYPSDLAVSSSSEGLDLMSASTSITDRESGSGEDQLPKKTGSKKDR